MYDKVYHKRNYTTGKSLFQLANAQNMKLVPFEKCLNTNKCFNPWNDNILRYNWQKLGTLMSATVSIATHWISHLPVSVKSTGIINVWVSPILRVTLKVSRVHTQLTVPGRNPFPYICPVTPYKRLYSDIGTFNIGSFKLKALGSQSNCLYCVGSIA